MRSTARRHVLPNVLVLTAVATVVAGCGGGSGDPSATEQPQAVAASTGQASLPPFNFEIRTLSNRADLISDGDALVEVTVPKTVPMKQGDALAQWHRRHLVVRRGRDGTNLARRADRPGGRRERVSSPTPTGSATAGRGPSLTITNHPRGGPVLLGAQTTPWICATPMPVAESGNTPASNASGLSTAAVDAQCNIATEYKLFYRTTTAGCSTALPDPNPPAAPNRRTTASSPTRRARLRPTWRRPPPTTA